MKIRDCKFSMKCFYSLGARLRSSAYELIVREKQRCCNKVSKGSNDIKGILDSRESKGGGDQNR